MNMKELIKRTLKLENKINKFYDAFDIEIHSAKMNSEKNIQKMIHLKSCNKSLLYVTREGKPPSDALTKSTRNIPSFVGLEYYWNTVDYPYREGIEPTPFFSSIRFVC